MDQEHSSSRTVERHEPPPRPQEHKGNHLKKDLQTFRTADQDRPHAYGTGYEFRRRHANESSVYPSSSQAAARSPCESPPEKRSRAEQTKNEVYEQKQKYKRQEEFLQRQMLEQKLSMYK